MLALAGGLGKLLLLAWLLAPSQGQANDAVRAGRAMFLGETALLARLATQQQALAATASRCINCHSAPGLRPATGTAPVPSASTSNSTRNGAGASPASYGPALNSAALLQPQARRGGPPSRYDAASLCRVLRDGVDPAGVMLNPAMPRYGVDDVQCRQLWTLLTSDL